MDDFLTVADVAERLKLNQQPVRNLIDRGELPACRVGRRVRIRREDVDALVEAGYTGRSRQTEPPTTATPTATIWDGDVAAPITPDELLGDT